ncbi:MULTISPECIES: hypothetical protein [unclassified Exiguobacterium]|uniref:hypothetical protein n=1 Tax=unclassified Exiguobacterium TaxID=2644629 RepID=UPI00103EF068|nr:MULTISPECIES: hypothetical protein [unclassified Exiguobacterium]TCI47958.1 hypothetical protein EVJ31_02655 [Exiguobacterium sp. SH5S32]TCI54840.1 hypothetical protein EVJ25_02650 [Exiguobacterium sp. SH1S4]TCI74637.1 hypothetical protein EVJ23_02650 [Exiguobacterium sp. SH1S1]
MGKFLKVTLIIVGVIVLGISVLAFSFVQSMKPDKDEEEKVKQQAEIYLEEHFDDQFEIYDVYFDNMGNFNFDYAAEVVDKRNQTRFFVYYDETTRQMIDTYAADKWADELEKEITPYVKQNFGDTTDVFALYDEEIGNKLGLEPSNPGSYKEHDAVPTIGITLRRKKQDDDEALFNDFISYLKTEDKLQHGYVMVDYIAENGELLEENYGWNKEF